MAAGAAPRPQDGHCDGSKDEHRDTGEHGGGRTVHERCLCTHGELGSPSCSAPARPSRAAAGAPDRPHELCATDELGGARRLLARRPTTDLDIISEGNGEADAFSADPRPGDLDTITKSDGECDRMSAYGPDDLDTITHTDGEVDSWRLQADPKPEPSDLDTITFTDNQAARW